MQTIESAQFTEDGNILAVIDGTTLAVPDIPENRHRQMIAAWEAQDNTIAPHEAPAVDLAAYTAARRWQKEVGGISVAGVAVATDDRSKMMIMGARLKAAADPGFSTGWKIAGGGFVRLGAAELIAISDAVLAHVDACFAIEAALLSAIAAGTITTTAGIDAAFDA